MLKWLEGALGLGGACIGLIITFAQSLPGLRTLDLASAYIATVPLDSPGALTPQLFTVLNGLPIIAASGFFAVAMTGTWLDLNGQRRFGKQLLIACLVGLLVAIFAMAPNALVIEVYVLICFMLILGATIIAALRREPSLSA